ncbi:MAG TPA: DUF2959 family protein [bacterium]|nr:DUF2959 family protein [bacterium]HPN36042.1 DUF2959 family protein [bacterium]
MECWFYEGNADERENSDFSGHRAGVPGRQFHEWSEEIKQYNSESLKKASQRKYDQAKAKYAELMKALKKAESKLEPALMPLRDQGLFIKYNLNAKAVAGLSDE